MAANPTRKTEVQAYSFEVRRMNSALVRRDSVMLHDPLRTHTRATIVGVVLSCIGLLGFLIFGILKPNAQPPGNGIIIGKESGQIYVKTDNPEMLIPTYNLASARLLLYGREQAATTGDGGAAPQGETEVVQPEVIPDERLVDIPRGRSQGIPDAPIIPSADDLISNNWAVCHYLRLDQGETRKKALDDARENAAERQETVVLAGVPDLGELLGPKQSILAEVQGKNYLIYRPEDNVNRKSDIVKAEVPADENIHRALQLDGEPIRPMSVATLAAIEETNALEAPVIEGFGDSTNADMGERNAVVGDVFSITRAGDVKEYYVKLRDGTQEITRAVADIIRFSNNPAAAEQGIPDISPDLLDGQGMQETKNPLPVEDYPEEVSMVLDPLQWPNVCLGWSIQDGEPRTSIYYGNDRAIPTDSDGKRKFSTKISFGGGNKFLIDRFYMPAGKSAVVNSAASKLIKTGPIQVISSNGRRFGVDASATAGALGLPKPRVAPDRIIQLLPAGGTLSVQAAARSLDSAPIPDNVGDYNGQDPDSGAVIEDGQ